jgi:HlyD family secretion protein
MVSRRFRLPRSIGQRTLRRSAAAGVIVLALLVTFVLAARMDGNATAPAFRTAAVERGRLVSFVAASGSLGAVTTVQVGSQISGQVQSLSADYNDRVTAEQLIARISPESFEARLHQAEAELAIAEATVDLRRAAIDRADADRGNAEARLASTRAQVDEAEATLAEAEREHARKKALFARKVISGAAVDDARAEFQRARARLTAARASVTAQQSAVAASRAQMRMARAERTTAKAQVLKRQAALHQAQVDLDHTFIRSPVRGTVIARNVDVGQTVAASLQAPVLFVIAEDLSRMQVEVDVDEADIGRIQVGQRTRFSVDSYPERRFTGQVSQIRLSPEVVQNVVTYTVVVAVNNAERLLLPGMTANVEIAVQERDDVLKVPNRALRFVPKGAGTQDKGSGRGGRDAGRSERIIASLTENLKLNEDQQARLRGFFDQAREKMRGLYTGGASREELREAYAQVAQQVRQSIPTILNAEQLAAYRKIVAQRNANPVRPGRVWVVDEDGAAKAVVLRVGASDGDFTEVVKGELAEGDGVIVAAERRGDGGKRSFLGFRF